MNVFICWSGRETASFAAAELLKDYLPLLHDNWVPFLSEYDIKAGTLWMDELFSALDASTYGIVCISPRQKDSPWILFEAGALSKAVSSNRVSPLLIWVEPSELADPLSKFQNKPFNKEGIEAILDSLCEASEFKDETRRVVFDRFHRIALDLKDHIKRIRQQAKEERKAGPVPPPEPPLIKILKDLQGQISDLAGRVQKLVVHESPVAPIPLVAAATVAPPPNTVIITAQPGQSLTVGDTTPPADKGD